MSKGPKNKTKRGMGARHFGPAGAPKGFDEETMKKNDKSRAAELVGVLKPMLAETCKNVDKVEYPVLATPKIDGIRCLTVVGGAPVSRSLKSIPNLYIRAQIEAWGIEGCDGELWIKGAENFGEVSGDVMRVEGEPEFEYLVFDLWDRPDLSYEKRITLLKHRLRRPRPSWVTLIIPAWCYNSGGLMKFWDECASRGYEGAIFRDPEGKYKFGRSTSGMMCKLKLFTDDEAEVIGFEELMHNKNEAKKNALGRTERSTSKAGKVPAGMLGRWECRDLKTGIEFKIGTGFSATQRKEFWQNRQVYVGMILKYKHQPSGALAKPRFPVFIAFRHPDDL